LVFAPISIASADLKIAVIDLSKAFDQYYKTQDAQKLLKQKQDGYQKEIQDLINEYQHMGETLRRSTRPPRTPRSPRAPATKKNKALDLKKQDLITMQTRFRR